MTLLRHRQIINCRVLWADSAAGLRPAGASCNTEAVLPGCHCDRHGYSDGTGTVTVTSQTTGRLGLSTGPSAVGLVPADNLVFAGMASASLPSSTTGPAGSSTTPWVEKYRPSTIDQVAHQDEVVNTLRNALATGNVSGPSSLSVFG